MRLFSLPDGTIDRNDRAQWLTDPFDMAFLFPVAAAATVIRRAQTAAETHLRRAPPPGSGGLDWGDLAFDEWGEAESWGAMPWDDQQAAAARIRRAPSQEATRIRRA